MTAFLKKLSLVLFGLLILVVIEGGLRLFYEPDDTSEIVWTEIDPYQVDGTQVVTKEAYLASFRKANFSQQKPPETLRIFAIGGSTTFGYPYPDRFAWPALLEKGIRQLTPKQQVEVINAGATSYGSSRALGVLRGILKYDPDMVVICVGDAEFVEDSYRAAVASRPSVVSWLHQLYLANILKNILPTTKEKTRVVSAEDGSSAGFLFAPVLDGTVYRPTDERRREVNTLLRENIKQMAELARSENIPIIFCTLPSNIASWPPDADMTRPMSQKVADEWETRWQKARHAVKDGNLEKALALFREANNSWNGNASLNYEYGQMLYSSGDYDGAYRHLTRARDLDPAPVRATGDTNGIILNVATEFDLSVVDLDRLFLKASPGGLTGEELILDYAHPTPSGHALIARQVWFELSRSINVLNPENPDLAKHIWEREQLSAETATPMNADLAFVLGQIFLRKGLLQRAEEMFRMMIDRGDNRPFVRMLLADVLIRQGNEADALIMLEQVVADAPDFTEPYRLLAYLYERSGNVEQAITYYLKAVESGDRELSLVLNLAMLQARYGALNESLELLQRSKDLFSNDCQFRALTGRLYENADRPLEAIAHYRDLLSDQPTCQLGWENLGVLQMDLNLWSDAEQTFVAALLQAEPLSHHYLNLATVYYRGLGQKGKALQSYRAYLQIDPGGLANVPDEIRIELTNGR